MLTKRIVNSMLFVTCYVIFIIEYLSSDLSILPSKSKFIIELLSLAILVLSIILFALTKKIYFSTKYIFLFFLFILLILLSAFYNVTDPLSMIIGMRAYFKSLPLFILAVVCNFNEKDITQQFYVLIPLLLLQTPVAFYQRFVEYKTLTTGDVVVGTLISSSQLTIIMLFALSLLYTFYLKKKIKLRTLIFLGLFIILPTAINETKITFILLPIIFLLPSYMIENKLFKDKARKYIQFAIFCVIFISVFMPIYGYLYPENKDKPGHSRLHRYFTDADQFKKYFYKGTTDAEEQDVRRIDTVVLAIKNIKQDLGVFLFGEGIGNIQDTKIKVYGRKTDDLQRYKADYITLTILLWETGICGVILFIVLLFLLIKDALYLKNNDNEFFSSFGIGIYTNLLIFLLCIIYTNFLRLNVINYLFWFYAGVIACRKKYIKENASCLEH